MTAANLARHRNSPNMPFWRMLKEGSDHFEVTHLEPKVDVCDKHYVFDAEPPANSTKPLTFSPTGRCPAYEVPQEIAGPALEKQRNDDYQIAQLTKENSPVAPVVLGTDGGMNRVFVAKLDTTQPFMDNEGHLHAPPVHPGMSTPLISGPRQDVADSSSRGLFGNLFDAKSSTHPSAPQNQVASAATSDQDHPGFFASLFKQKSEAQQPPGPPGAVLYGLKPAKSEPAKTEAAKVDVAATPQKQTPQVADATKAKAKSQPAPAQQDANAAASTSSTGSLIKGAQPVLPSGGFEGRWAGLQ